MIDWVHPGLLFFIAAIATSVLGESLRKSVQWAVPLLALLFLLTAPDGNYGLFSVMGLELVFGRVDRLSRLFGVVFTLSTLIGMIYSLHLKQRREIIAAFVYAGSALGAVFAGDLLSLFLFWEIMAFSSVLLVWFAGPKSWAPGMRYLMVHIFGGLCLLIGIVLYVAYDHHPIAFAHIAVTGVGPALILVGILINAAAVPMHAWLSDAYPEATVTGAVFMSALTTKTAVCLLIRAFAGTEVLMVIGVIMAVYGAIYAILDNDIRRVLAYGIISQVGYMVTGVGIGSELALNGASAHAFSHILYKGLLMMAMGSVIFMTGRRKMTELGGLYKSMPVTFFLYLVGALSIAGFPLFSGFVSKSMIISAAGEGHHSVLMALLTLVSCGTFLYTGLKLPYFVFFGKPSDIVTSDPPANMKWAMALAAFLCFVVGVFPDLLYQGLPYKMVYHPYTIGHVLSAMQLLFLTAAVFLMLRKLFEPRDTVSIDCDWFYRAGTCLFLWIAKKPLAQYEEWITEAYQSVLIRPAKAVSRWAWSFDTWVVDGVVNGTGFLTLLESRVSSFFDMQVVDGTVNGFSTLLDFFSRQLRRLQTGLIQNYLLAMVAGVVVLAVFFVF
jgi:multicomponent Na+:H+ antiporter subunit D